MKRKILLIAVLAICLSLVAYGTLAYFTYEDTAHNVITTGSVGIQLVEKTVSDDTLVDFPEEGLTGIMPGTSASKIVSVKNTGSATAWIRVKVEMTITGADGAALPTVLENGSEKIPVITFTADESWTLAEDGYYYYSSPVDAGDTTATLFEEVHFAPEMGNEYQNCTANLIISAQAVQTANNGATVMDAQGWPAADDGDNSVQQPSEEVTAPADQD